jgi:dihydroorotate dehydrogenase (NAD+) catalytic subunit
LNSVDLRSELAGVELPNPIVAASGCAGYGRELSRFYDLRELGALITKSIMVSPRAGRPTPRMAETSAGMLNSIGLQGPGIDEFLERDLPWLAARRARVGVSIAGFTVEEYASLAGRLRNAEGVHFIEVNISCPNVEDRGQVFACWPESAAEVVSVVHEGAGSATPILAKLSADVTDVVSVAAACVEAGASGLSLINTLLGMAIDSKRFRPVLASETGGLSGPAIKPVALRCIWQVHQAMPHVPILGGGGVFSGTDALEFALAGASAVSVGTATFHDPHACVRIRGEVATELARRALDSFGDLIGGAHDQGRAALTAAVLLGDRGRRRAGAPV